MTNKEIKEAFFKFYCKLSQEAIMPEACVILHCYDKSRILIRSVGNYCDNTKHFIAELSKKDYIEMDAGIVEKNIKQYMQDNAKHNFEDGVLVAKKYIYRKWTKSDV